MSINSLLFKKVVCLKSIPLKSIFLILKRESCTHPITDIRWY